MTTPTPIPANTPADAPAESIRRGSPLFPCLIALTAGLCIMTVELLAGNVVAGVLGASLYTWTAVIGVIMAGLALGNYLGGWTADRFEARRSLGVVFLLSALACATIIALNARVGGALDDWDIGPPRIAAHVSLVFILPGTLLGFVTPLVVKMALDQGRARGRTVGAVYAANAAGSIAGTFLTGFVLIPALPTSRTIWAISAILALLGLLLLTFPSWTRRA
jgi:MFS family permease